MKKYADEARKVKRHCLGNGDVVLVAQKKKKLSTVYEPNLCEIEKVKGSMITARRSIDGRRSTRNNSYYKRVHETEETMFWIRVDGLLKLVNAMMSRMKNDLMFCLL